MKDTLQTELIQLFLFMCFFRKSIPVRKKREAGVGTDLFQQNTRQKSGPDGGWVTAIAGPASDKGFVLGHPDFASVSCPAFAFSWVGTFLSPILQLFHSL